jgi:hypothetical protein
MKRFSHSWPITLLIAGAAFAQTGQPPPSGHVFVQVSDLKWGPAPPGLPAGAKTAVLSGDPSQAGPFVLRAALPAGYRIAPHWHPTDENLTVISGTFSLGMGDKFDEKAIHDLNAGGYVRMPATTRHFATTKTATVIQIHGMGPFVINYVNPADDPRGNAPAK